MLEVKLNLIEKMMSIDKKEPLVYVLTLNWNTKEMTIECIHSILSSDYPNFKIVVVDNNSSDGSVIAFKKEFGEEIINLETGENLGYGRGMNFGLTYAAKFNPEYFFIMNNDTKIDPSAISEMVKTAKKYNNNCLVTGKVYHYDKTNVIQHIGGYRNSKTLKFTPIGRDEIDKGQFDEEMEREAIDDMFMLFPKKVYDDIGGYSKYFFMNYEQTDLVIRARNKGYKLIYCPKAKLWHKGSHSTGGLGNPKMMYWDAQSTIILHFLHQSRMDFIKFYFSYFFIAIKGMLKSFIKQLLHKPERENYFLTSYAHFRGLLSGSLWLIRKKEASNYNPF